MPDRVSYISKVETQQPHSPSHITPDPVPEPSTGPQSGFFSAFAINPAPLRISRDYRLLFLSQTISFFGSMMSFVVLPWQMYQLTHSSLLVGLLGVTEFIPTITMAFVGGALADYVDRRRMVLITELLMAVSSVVLVLNSLLSRPHVWVLFVCATAIRRIQRPQAALTGSANASAGSGRIDAGSVSSAGRRRHAWRRAWSCAWRSTGYGRWPCCCLFHRSHHVCDFTFGALDDASHAASAQR